MHEMFSQFFSFCLFLIFDFYIYVIRIFGGLVGWKSQCESLGIFCNSDFKWTKFVPNVETQKVAFWHFQRLWQNEKIHYNQNGELLTT